MGQHCVDGGVRAMLYDENDEPEDEPMDDRVDDDGDPLEDDDGPLCPEDGAGDGDGATDDAEDLDAAEAHRGAAGGWVVMLSERDEHGGWRTVGEPVPDATFETMALAHDFAELRNRRQFGHGFDWAKEPPRAWIAVHGRCDALRVHEPEPELISYAPRTATALIHRCGL